MNKLSNLPLLLYLVSIPLISMGTTADRPGLMWIGFLALLSASLITPTLRFRENTKETGPSTQLEKPEGDKK